jgi:hypothetical protein
VEGGDDLPQFMDVEVAVETLAEGTGVAGADTGGEADHDYHRDGDYRKEEELLVSQ